MEITVICGATEHDINVESGSTVQTVYTQIKELFNLPNDVSVKVNSNPSDLARGVCDGDEIEFTKSTGRKG